jgi:2-keto-4-pentenoate hydratase/2-oxohepta-3-ene-1,7-dioic acid hydratase in catechol pathway
MRLVSFTHHGRAGVGALTGTGQVVDFAADPDLPTTMLAFVAAGEPALRRAAALLAAGGGLSVADVRLRAPIRPANNVMCIGKNYVEHAHEFAQSGFDASQRQALPTHPIVFTKAVSSIAGPDDDVDVSADGTGTTDYEGELGVVIGRGGTRIRGDDAWEHVYGYTVINDLTVRELQKRHVQFFLGKSAAGYCPMGPAIVTREEIEDITAAWVRTRVNGEERQAAPVSDLIFSIPTLIEAISTSVLLSPGDVIATGTPAGVGIGFDPPRYLAPGDVVEVSVDGVGTLTNTAV